LSDSPIFELVCEEVEREARLTRLEARGTVRLLLKEVGLDPQFVTKGAAILAADRFLVPALRARRVAEPERVKAAVLQALVATELENTDDDDPEAIFSRITLRR
jgi:hypothetical protein